jgi:hypothetical protein
MGKDLNEGLHAIKLVQSKLDKSSFITMRHCFTVMMYTDSEVSTCMEPVYYSRKTLFGKAFIWYPPK